MKAYIILKTNWEYNDYTYDKQGFLGAHKTFLTRQQAKTKLRELNLNHLNNLLNSDFGEANFYRMASLNQANEKLYTFMYNVAEYGWTYSPALENHINYFLTNLNILKIPVNHDQPINSINRDLTDNEYLDLLEYLEVTEYTIQEIDIEV